MPDGGAAHDRPHAGAYCFALSAETASVRALAIEPRPLVFVSMRNAHTATFAAIGADAVPARRGHNLTSTKCDSGAGVAALYDGDDFFSSTPRINVFGRPPLMIMLRRHDLFGVGLSAFMTVILRLRFPDQAFHTASVDDNAPSRSFSSEPGSPLLRWG